MATLGQGIIPVGGTGTPGQELVNATRRIFVPRLFVQLGKACPTFAMLLRSARIARGGVSPVTISTQNVSMVSGAWTGYLGQFNAPQPIPGINYNAEFNQNMFVIPIPFLFSERAITDKARIVDILAARMSDARRYFQDQMGTNVLFSLNNGTNVLQPSGLLDAYDDGTNTTNGYGGITTRSSTNNWWAGNYASSAGGILSRKSFYAAIIQVATKGYGNGTGAGGEAPDTVIMSPGDWVTLQQDFQTQETIFLTPGSQFGQGNVINSGFAALTLGGVKIFFDQYCPTGSAFIINSKYLALFLNEMAPFAFTGWESTIPVNQLGWVGALVILLSIVCASPRSGGYLTGITGHAF